MPGDLTQRTSRSQSTRNLLTLVQRDDAVSYAQAAHAVASLIDRTVERRDSVRLKPMLDAMENWVAEYGDAVREPQLGHWR